MAKPNAQTTLKSLALAATTGAVVNLGIQVADGRISPFSITFTLLAVIGIGAAVADDTRRALHAVRAHISRRNAINFRNRHGDPAGWDDDEYEAYFAITARQTRRTNIQPAA